MVEIIQAGGSTWMPVEQKGDCPFAVVVLPDGSEVMTKIPVIVLGLKTIGKKRTAAEMEDPCDMLLVWGWGFLM
eukprot:6473561-Amphidinium_carterae.1